MPRYILDVTNSNRLEDRRDESTPAMAAGGRAWEVMPLPKELQVEVDRGLEDYLRRTLTAPISGKAK
jgi:hypothetical protein